MTADLVIANADVVTMDPLNAFAEAVAVRNGRIVAAGSNAAIAAFAGADTTTVDAGGATLLPGLQDTHIHLQDGGLDLAQNAPLWDVRCEDELVAALQRHAQIYRGPFVIGTGWQPGVFTDATLTRHVLDRAVGDRPLMIYDSGYHNACLNTLACEAIGAVRGASDPPNGRFVRDDSGAPTGMLHEDACVFARERLPRRTEDDYFEGLLAGQAHCNANGITGVLDAQVMDRHCAIYRRMEEAGKLTVRVAATAMAHAHETLATVLERLRRYRQAYRSDLFKVNSAKFFLDGVLENRTAAMLAPYSDAAGGNAPLMFEPQQILDWFAAVDAERFQIHVHAIGDRAVRAALDGLAQARRLNGAWPSLHQIAHVQVIDPADVARFGELDAMANLQALWARHEPDIPDFTMAMVGPERAPMVYAFRSLIDAGAPFCLSSDWPVSSLNPFEIMETAMTRQTPDTRQQGEPFFAEQRLSAQHCLQGYTVNAAAAAWRAASTGSLQAGKFADMTLIDRNPLRIAPSQVGKTKVLATWLGGRQVH